MTEKEIIDRASDNPIGRILSMLQLFVNGKVDRLVENSGRDLTQNDLKSLGIEIHEFIQGMKLVSETILQEIYKQQRDK